MAAKYADVMPAAEAIEVLRGMAAS